MIKKVFWQSFLIPVDASNLKPPSTELYYRGLTLTKSFKLVEPFKLAVLSKNGLFMQYIKLLLIIYISNKLKVIVMSHNLWSYWDRLQSTATSIQISCSSILGRLDRIYTGFPSIFQSNTHTWLSFRWRGRVNWQNPFLQNKILLLKKELVLPANVNCSMKDFFIHSLLSILAVSL